MEYIALIRVIYDIVNFMVMMKEVSFLLYIHLPKLEVYCKLFEDNQSCIYVAESNKFSLRTKHIAIKYHHLQSFVKNKIIQVC